MTQLMVDAENLMKRYGTGERGFTALSDVSFRVPEGRFVSIVGPSGCGKSTLLQIVGGLTDATSGEIRVAGTRVTGPQPGKIAIVFQDALLLPWKRAVENVEFPLDIQGLPKAERRARALEMLQLVGLADFASRYPHELSGGMRQRVSIARALAQQPRMVLMDEPFGALDEQTRLKMGAELLRIWEARRKTVLFVTHSLSEALFLSDTVLVMAGRPGRIVDVIDVDFPRPRSYDVVGSEEFGHLRNRIWHQINDYGLPPVNLAEATP